MKLEKPITLQPFPYTDQNDKIVQPPPVTIEELKPTFVDNTSLQHLSVNFEGVQYPLMLVWGDTYTAMGDYQKSELVELMESTLGDDPQTRLQSLYPKTLEADPNGPGTILTNMIKTLGIKSSSSCSCRRHALKMNAKGADWCKDNLGEICAWIKEESKKRKIPYVETVVKIMVNRAINKSKKLESKKV